MGRVIKIYHHPCQQGLIQGWGAEILSHLILAPYTSYQILAPQPIIASYAWISDYPFAKIMWGAKTYLAPLSRLKSRIRPWAPIMKFSNKVEFSSIDDGGRHDKGLSIQRKT